jgi:tetratricopeptide (TPR) repeat protein
MFFLSMLASIEVSEEIGQKILPILRSLDIDKELAFCLMSLGINCSYRGEYERGEQYLKEALQITVRIQDFVGNIGCRIWLGWVYYEAGDHASALEQWEEGQELSIEIDNRLMLAFVQSKIALLGEETGDYENAIRVQLQARENFRHFADQVGNGYATSRLTLSLMGIGEYQEAKRVGQESFLCFKEMNHRWGIPASLCRIGFAEIELGEHQAAWEHFSEALALSQKVQIDTLVLYALVGLGRLLVRQNQLGQGIEILTHVIAEPATPSLYRKIAEESLDEIAGDLPEDRYAAYKEKGERLTLDEILRALP